MIVIETGIEESKYIGSALASCGIDSIGWDSKIKPLFKMVSEQRPELIIYNINSDVRGIKKLKEASPALPIGYIGDDTDNVVADFVIGKSKTKPVITVPESIFPLSTIIVGKEDHMVSSDICCFTHGITQDKANETRELVIKLCSLGCRFFGFPRLDVKNYLGIVDADMKANIIKSSKVCIDLDGTSWKNIIMTGGRPIVYSNSDIKNIKTFNDEESLVNCVKTALEDSIDCVVAKKRIMQNTFFDLCASMFYILGAKEAAQVVLDKKDTYK